MSYIAFPLLILSFIPQMLKLANAENPVFLFYPLSDAITLSIFYVLAIYFRKNVSKHMRFMIGTALVFLSPTLGRIGPKLLGLPDVLSQNIIYGIIILMLVGLIFLDKKNGKRFQPYLVILGVWLIHLTVFNLLF